jgi:MoaA/NifB/PqqE/SkfB family radical SAM enzyme
VVKLPRAILLENVSYCNLACLSCDRNSIRRTQGNATIRPQLDKVVEAVRLLQPETIYYFKLGEPFLSPSIQEEVKAVLSASPHSRIICSTNGVPMRGAGRVEAALMMDEIYVSLDGINTAMVNRYQVGGNFDTAYGNMKSLVAERKARGLTKPEIHWRYVVFNWNDRPATIHRAIELAREAGVDTLSLLKTHSPPWGFSWRWHWHNYDRLGQRIGPEVKIKTNSKQP